MGQYSSRAGTRQAPILPQRCTVVRFSPVRLWAVRAGPSGTGSGTGGPYRCGAVRLRIEQNGSTDPITSRPPMSAGIALMSDRARRILPLLIGLALILPAAVPAITSASSDQSSAEAIILKKMNYERTKRGLVALRLDTRIAAIARDRSEYQARTGDADHTQGSNKVFDFIQAAGIKWYAAGEIIAQNRYYPSIEDSAAAAIKGWLGSSTHRSILLSKG